MKRMTILFFCSLAAAAAVSAQDTKISGEYHGSSEWPNGDLLLSICPVKQTDWDSLPASIPRREGGWRCIDIATTTAVVKPGTLQLTRGSSPGTLIHATIYPCVTKLREYPKDPPAGLCLRSIEPSAPTSSQASRPPTTTAKKRDVPPGFTVVAAEIGTAGEDYDSKTVLARQFNSTLSDLRVMKNVDKGILRIEFVMDYSHPCPTCVFLMRLFDKNGRYLTHFETEPHFKLLGVNRRGPEPQSLDYPVSQRDLQFSTIAEFGVEVP